MRASCGTAAASKSFLMPNKMLIDATHPEETRVVVVRGNRVEEFDFEAANRKQLRGNIYLAKVTRVEPSLQAAFIEYGGNRHGFLAFSEIHPDYYQIPVADRQALIEAEEQAHREAEEETESRPSRRRSRHRSARRRGHGERVQSQIVEGDNSVAADAEAHGDNNGDNNLAPPVPTDTDGVTGGHDGPETSAALEPDAEPDDTAIASGDDRADDHPADDTVASATPTEAPGQVDPAGDVDIAAAEDDSHEAPAPAVAADDHDDDSHADDVGPDDAGADDNGNGDDARIGDEDHDANGDDEDSDDDDDNGHDDHVESVGGDDVLEEVPERAFRPRRQYKIQEVIKRRQVMLVQVVKEERGNKGAALTTYLSLAGRYAVLMPNTARGGGISRKITSSQDRSRLKEVVQDLDVPEGMGVILRTAGAARTKPEIKRDFEYLLRMWETVRDTTLNSQAPTLVYEEGSLIKRSLRDLYNKDIDDIIVAGEAGYREARDFMKMLMPSSVRAVKPYRDAQPLFSRMGVESQLDAMFSPTVQLRSGGYLVINQTEALVSIDVNSGRSTREHHIEDTALKTNLEAAEEVARQLRLRDLAGLIVIDFIDMDEKRNNRAVERKIADCLKQDRARIQIGRISHFGLLEMSRQRIRASMLESSTETCPHCGGSGRIRSVGSVALQLLRGLEEVLMKGATHNLVVRTRTDVALYVLNHKRGHLHDLETAFQVAIAVAADANVSGQQSFVIDRGDQVHTLEAAKALLAARSAPPPAIEEAAENETFETGHDEAAAGEDAEAPTTADHDDGGEDENGDGRRRRRRRRRGRGREARDEHGSDEAEAPSLAPAIDGGQDEHAETDTEASGEIDAAPADTDGENGERRPRRRGRRGGRRRRGEGGAAAAIADELDLPSEPEVAEAVADLADPSSDTPPEIPAPQDAGSTDGDDAGHEAPAATEAEAITSPEPEGAAKPRRRSTVREKVTFLSQPAQQAAPDASAAPEPAPAAEPAQPAQDSAPAETPPSPADDDGTQPRRLGWWARRFGGA